MKKISIITISLLTAACQTNKIIEKDAGYYTVVNPSNTIEEIETESHRFDQEHKEVIEKGQNPKHQENHIHDDVEINGNSDWYGLVRFTDSRASKPEV